MNYRQIWNFLRLSLLAFLGAIALSGMLIKPSAAHSADFSVAEIAVQETQTQIKLTLPTSLVAIADDNQDEQLSAPEILAHQAELETLLSQRILLTNSMGQRGTLSLDPNAEKDLSANMVSASKTHSNLTLIYTWSQPIDNLNIDYQLFIPGIADTRCLATIFYAGETQNFIFTPDNSQFSLQEDSWWRQASSFVVLGIEHILTGYDHILFLISLLLVGSSLGNLLKMVTAFTVAHSVTLSLSVLNIVSLPSSLVESVIALSIVYVAAENLWRQEIKQRWLIAFAFGLIHGLGFAGILQEINISGSNLFLYLASFNIGVEVGQAIIVAVAFLVLRALPKRPWVKNLQSLASFSLVIVGVFWFVQRAFPFYSY